MSRSAALVLSPTAEDAAAVEAMRRHRAELATGLAVRVKAFLLAVDLADQVRTESLRAEIASFCQVELLPHAEAEEATVYLAAAELPALRALVSALRSEDAALRTIVEEVAAAASPARAAAAARAMDALLQAHLEAENEVLLPLLAAEAEVSLVELAERMRREFAERQALAIEDDLLAETGDGSGCSGGCACGGSDEAAPELDVRAIPHAIRHGSVFGAFDAVRPGHSLVLIAPHDPLPLLRLLTERVDGRLDVEYLERGPEMWKLKLTATRARAWC